MFEPNQFQSNLRHYGFYIDMSSADAEVDAYASYEEYAKEDSYRVPAQENRIYISAPIGMEICCLSPTALQLFTTVL